MTIRDRGKIKWQSAAFLPEHTAMLKEMNRDTLKQRKPILDEYQIEEIENVICYAMEFTYKVKLTVWEDGFDWEYTGLIHRLDEITKIIYLEHDDGFINRVNFGDIIDITVLE